MKDHSGQIERIDKHSHLAGRGTEPTAIEQTAISFAIPYEEYADAVLGSTSSTPTARFRESL
ncbi:MAG: hypothetical protein Tsb009_28640 [Planctomycetaceae bacterium]